MENNYIKIKCMHCGQIQQTLKVNAHTAMECALCKERIIAVPLEEPGASRRKSELPGTLLAKIWNMIGALALAVGGISLFISLFDHGQDGKIIGFFGLNAVIWSIIPFSVAAIIKAINANTLEIRKLGERHEQ